MKIMLDSGSFSAWSIGGRIDLKSYTKFIERNEHLLDSYVSLDVIPGAHGQMDWRAEAVEASAAASYANHQKMKDAGLSPIPVFHQGERLEWLARYIEDGETYIGISPYEKSPVGWLGRCFETLKGRPIRTHCFGFTNHLILSNYPWSSADSTTWTALARNGRIVVPVYIGSGQWDYSVRPDIISVTDGSRHQSKHLNALDPTRFEFVRRYLHEVIGIDLAEARYSVAHRQRCNIRYFQRLEAIGHPLRIIFATNTDRKLAQVMSECGAQSRLLSYFLLKDMSEDALENYTRCTARPSRPRKRREVFPIKWSPSYCDKRKLALWKRFAAIEEEAAA
jgi:hypothetical protein